MTLDEFIEEQKALLVRFENYWRKNNADDCGSFPYSMEAGEWDEQWLAYYDMAHD